MENRMNRTGILLAATLGLCLLTALPGAALAQRGRILVNSPQTIQNRDPLLPLKNALQAAGAVALSSDQETKINGLISDFRTANKPASPSADVQAARIALDESILGNKLDDAAKAINTIIKAQTTQTQTSMVNTAVFASSVVTELTADQITPLKTRMGTGGLVSLIESLVGGPGGLLGRGPGGSGQGRGAQGQARIAIKK